MVSMYAFAILFYRLKGSPHGEYTKLQQHDYQPSMLPIDHCAVIGCA